MPRLSLARLTPRRLLHLPSRTVRLRLTLLYGGLFLVSGAMLLAITYLLFRRATGINLIVVPTGTSHGSTGPDPLKHLLARTSPAMSVTSPNRDSPRSNWVAAPSFTNCSSSRVSRWRS
jgi:hypothetical protein